LPKLPDINAKKAELMLTKAGFQLIRSKGSHRIYQKDDSKIVIPFHGNKSLHPKIVKSILEVLNEI
jgi:predicted RNA binding protein YcfA (HicA-like mRNA interferase family)